MKGGLEKRGRRGIGIGKGGSGVIFIGKKAGRRTDALWRYFAIA